MEVCAEEKAEVADAKCRQCEIEAKMEKILAAQSELMDRIAELENALAKEREKTKAMGERLRSAEEGLAKVVKGRHLDRRVAIGRPVRPLPQKGRTRRESSLLQRLRIGCYWTAARRYRLGLSTSQGCTSCDKPETLERVLLFCPANSQPRGALQEAYRNLGHRSIRQEDLLFLDRNLVPALQSLVEYFDSTGFPSSL
ncbi:hypothetical protein HPB50_006747 [Hyalomma asiaticum]|uniref:Uncharacterized protein n=1 Tax=Hyalomma asiaticum TaxID=266040 RepID=A0ACB7TDD5_HYAAI|nr:hypothetical protein HPB50_006747 [Hyalomma asiaticum]